MDEIERLADRHGLNRCLGCGKCVAACPMSAIFHEFSYEVSPRGLVERAGLGPELMGYVGVWYCLICDRCTRLCPAGVSVGEFVAAIRGLSLQEGITDYACFCRACGLYLWPQRTATHLKEMLGDASAWFLTLCPRCRQYETGSKLRALAPGGRRATTQKAWTGKRRCS